MIVLQDALLNYWKVCPVIKAVPIFDALPNHPDLIVPRCQIFQKFEGGGVRFTTGYGYTETYEYGFELFVNNREQLIEFASAIEDNFDQKSQLALPGGPLVHITREIPFFTQKMNPAMYRLIAIYIISLVRERKQIGGN